MNQMTEEKWLTIKVDTKKWLIALSLGNDLLECIRIIIVNLDSTY